MEHKQNASPEQSTRAIIDSFNDAFNRHDVDALAALLWHRHSCLCWELCIVILRSPRRPKNLSAWLALSCEWASGGN